MDKNRPTVSRPTVGVSACLIGEKVRYDGEDKLNAAIMETIAPHVDLDGFCPEVNAGMNIPREPFDLMLDKANYVNGIYRSGPLRGQRIEANIETTVTQFLHRHRAQPLCGYIFKSRSPSCGLGSTPIYQDDQIIRHGNGIFAAGLVANARPLACVEESWLQDTERCYRFLSAVWILFIAATLSAQIQAATHRWRELLSLVSLSVDDLDNRARLEEVMGALLDDSPTAHWARLVEYWRNK